MCLPIRLCKHILFNIRVLGNLTFLQLPIHRNMFSFLSSSMSVFYRYPFSVLSSLLTSLLFLSFLFPLFFVPIFRLVVLSLSFFFFFFFLRYSIFLFFFVYLQTSLYFRLSFTLCVLSFFFFFFFSSCSVPGLCAFFFLSFFPFFPSVLSFPPSLPPSLSLSLSLCLFSSRFNSQLYIVLIYRKYQQSQTSCCHIVT